jgi:hypothetical protein
MSKRFLSPEPSDVAIAAAIAATAYHLLHNHSQYAPAELVQHFIPELAAFTVGGAILFAIAAILLNRHKRKK